MVGDTANRLLILSLAIGIAYIIEKRQQYNFSVVLLITLSFSFIKTKYLNKEESKVIFMREFEISLFQTQCLPII